MAGMTTVLHIITGLGSGGSERMLTRVATAPLGVRQVVVSLMGKDFFDQKLVDAKVEYHCLNLNHGWLAPVAFLRLVDLIRCIRPDVVMTWLYHADFLGTFAALACGVPMRRIVWNLRCSRLDFHDYAITTRWLTRVLARLSSRPGAITHNSHAGRLAHEALGYRPRRWVYTPNGFDAEEWFPDEADRRTVRAEWKMADEQRVVGMVARYSPQKDFPTFFRTACLVAEADPRARFVLIGRGTENLGIPAVLQDRLLALGERQDVHRLIRAFDVSVLTSAYGEGFSNALGEAMASGVPCVSTDVGDTALILGDAGHTEPVGRADLLARDIVELLTRPEAERTVAGSTARQRIVDHWSLPKAIVGYKALWTEIVS
jgi:glycosyltransferase involved in cell wall biosynthesis